MHVVVQNQQVNSINYNYISYIFNKNMINLLHIQ